MAFNDWNRTLGALGVVAACGPTIPQDTAASTGDATEPTAPTSGPTTTEPPPTEPTTPPVECDDYEDCDHLYCGFCTIDGRCESSVGCCEPYALPGFHRGRCQPPPDCYSDEECPPDEICDFGFCVPIALPQLRPCLDPGPVLSAWQLGATPGAFALADLDADGDLDLAAAQPSVAGVELAFNDGVGVFTTSQVIAVGPPTSALAIDAGDLDGDGDVDLAVARGDAGGGLILAFSEGGVFMTKPSLPTEPGPTAVRVRRLDDDPFADVLTLGPTQVTTRRGDALGALATELVAVAAAVDPPGWLFDLDRDGRQDLVAQAAGTATAGVWIGQADATFTAALALDAVVPQAAVLAGDLGPDADPPALVLGRTEGAGGQIEVHTLGDDPDGFDPPTTYFTGLPITGGSLLELDAPDGVDLLAATGESSVLIALGDGAGGFMCERVLAVEAPTTASLLAAGDLDGQGLPDILVGDASSPKVTLIRLQ